VNFDRVPTSDAVAAFVRPLSFAVETLVVRDRGAALDEALRTATERLRMSDGTGSIGLDVRSMYRRFGVDPTKTRPSSEALLRRVRKGDGLPRVNNVVDVINWCSLESQLPFGLYDLDRVTGSVVLRLGQPGESYAGIRKDDVHLEGRLVLSDGAGPFGNPTSDSARTMVTDSTTRVLVVIFAPSQAAAEFVEQTGQLTADRISAFCR
jgi:DNA/RNA-binding domain of Phe-tRNA-synthetase-like protein